MGEPYSRVVTGATPAVTARSALSASTGATANPDSATPLEPEKSKVSTKPVKSECYKRIRLLPVLE